MALLMRMAWVARIVTGTYKHELITPVLAKLHWLPVYYRIQFKIAVITFKALTTQQPHYLSEYKSMFHIVIFDLPTLNALLFPERN